MTSFVIFVWGGGILHQGVADFTPTQTKVLQYGLIYPTACWFNMRIRTQI